MPEAARPICAKCHLPVREGEPESFHQGKTYHRDCAPAPGSAGDKNDPNPLTPISI